MDARAWVRALGRRVAAVVRSVTLVVGPRSRIGRGFEFPASRPPAWLQLPIWLDHAWAPGRAGCSSRGTLGDVLWGQYALFLSIRIQDDLLDRHRDDLRWIFVADRFLLESLASFQRCAGLGSDFWALFRASLRDTVEGILRVRELETRPGGSQSRHLQLHARVSAIFKLGAAAVCCLHGRVRDARWLAAFQDQHALFSQIVDDLEDLAEDLRDGRFTWVANTLLAARLGELIPPHEQARRLAEGLMRPERVGVIVERLRRAASGAAAAVPGSAPPAVRKLVRALQGRADAVERRLHHARVRWVLGDAVGSRG